MNFIRANNFNICDNLVELDLNWDIDQLDNLLFEGKSNSTSAEWYFRGRTYSEITLRVPKGLKEVYDTHKLWGWGFKIVEK